MLKRYRVSKPDHGGQEWLNERFWDKEGNKRVSASAVAAVFGVHPFVATDTYAAELLSNVPPTPIPPNPAMERGNRLEPFVMEWASDKLGVPYFTPDEMFVAESKGGARMIATLDGFHEEGDVRKVLEIKTTTRPWEGDLPDYWRIQGIQQAICADVEEITWAVFDPQMILHLHTQTVTPAEQAEHISGVERWLNAIDLGMTPPGVKWSYETINRKYLKAEAVTKELPTEALDIIERLKHVKAEAKAYAELEDQLKAELCDLIGEADSATVNGTLVATWKPQTRDSLDIKAFKAAMPEIAKQFSKQTTTRTLLLKGK